MWRGLEVERTVRESRDARQDLVSSCRPDEQLGSLDCARKGLVGVISNSG